MIFVKSVVAFFQSKDCVSILKDILNMLFFIITGTITIFTYLKAKKTILQPIKTEVFKQQLNIFSDIMEIFNGKEELEIRNFFAIDKLILANSVRVIDNYASLFFDININNDERPYSNKHCPRSIVTQEYVEKYFEKVDEYVTEELAASIDSSKPDPMTKAVIWKNYRVGVICIPKELLAAEKQINKIMKSPLLPKECVQHLKNIMKITEKNIDLLRTTLEETAQELPQKYSNKKLLSKASLGWIHNKFNNNIISYSEETEKLINFLRHYLKVDELLQ